jgi:hypothetical protein
LIASDVKPCAPFCLKPKENESINDLLQNLKCQDGYAVGFRRAVNLETGKLSGLKSHDYHIFMERHFPIMFHRYLNDDMWKTLFELSHFDRQLCAKDIKKEMMEKLGKEMLMLKCKLEYIFPIGWLNPMQYLLVHLPYEAKVGGPQQYKWMDDIERALKKLRSMVGNKARVEGCITEEFKLKEIAYFTSV